VVDATTEFITAAMKEELRAALCEHAGAVDTTEEARGNAPEGQESGLTARRVDIEMPTEAELVAMGIDPTQLHTQTEQDKIINLITSQVLLQIGGGAEARAASTTARTPRKARDSSFLSALALANKRRLKPTGRKKAATTASA
jgi:hypothetical protein